MAEKKAKAPALAGEDSDGLVKRVSKLEVAVGTAFGILRILRRIMPSQFGQEFEELTQIDLDGDGVIGRPPVEKKSKKDGKIRIGLVGLLAAAMATATIATAVVPSEQADVAYWDGHVAIRGDGDLECATNAYVIGTMYATNGGFVGDIVIEDVNIAASPLDLIYPVSIVAELGRMRFDAQATGTGTASGDFFAFGLLAEDDLGNGMNYAALQFVVAHDASNSVDGAIRAVYYADDVLVTNATIDASGITLVSGSFVGNGTSITNIDAGNIAPLTVLTAVDGNAVTNLDAGNIAGATVITAIDGAAITNIDAANIDASSTASAFDGSAITALDAANLTAATVATAIDGNAITNISADNIEISSTYPASDGGAITNIVADNIQPNSTYPASDGGAITNVTAGNVSGDGGSITNLIADNIQIGSTFTASDGSAITNVVADNIQPNSTYPASDGGAITNIVADNIQPNSTFPACDGGAITNITGTASTNGTVLNALDISNCTNFPADSIQPGSTYPTSDANALTNLNLANGSGSLSVSNVTMTGVLNLGVNSQTVTNGQLLVSLEPGMNLLDPQGTVANGTNVLTIGAGVAGEFYGFANASTATQKIAIVQSGVWVGAAIELEVGDPAFGCYGATNKFYGHD
ncbi:MAG: hypothetical protein JRL30_17085 [Deltaproteobacteria bacterium]|nr:hypothetical protein [Deltaproteobacteria bacterium]